AAGLRVRSPAGGNCLLDLVSLVRLARSVCRRSAPGLSCVVHPDPRSGIAGVAAPTAHDLGFLERGAARGQTALGTFSLCHFANDGVQRDVAWDAGHVSNFSRRTTPLRGNAKGGDRDHLRFRRNLRWNGGRPPLAKVGPSSLDYFVRCVWDRADSS